MISCNLVKRITFSCMARLKNIKINTFLQSAKLACENQNLLPNRSEPTPRWLQKVLIFYSGNPNIENNSGDTCTTFSMWCVKSTSYLQTGLAGRLLMGQTRCWLAPLRCSKVQWFMFCRCQQKSTTTSVLKICCFAVSSVFLPFPKDAWELFIRRAEIGQETRATNEMYALR